MPTAMNPPEGIMLFPLGISGTKQVPGIIAAAPVAV